MSTTNAIEAQSPAVSSENNSGPNNSRNSREGGGRGSGRSGSRGRGRGRGNRRNNNGGGGRGGGQQGNGNAKKGSVDDYSTMMALNPNGKAPVCTPAYEYDIESDTEKDDTPSHHYCLICCSSTLHKHRGITPCGHDNVCASCHMRLRYLHNDKKCPVCKTENDKLIIAKDTDFEKENSYKSFEEYNIWGDDIGSDFVYREDISMFFPVEYYHAIVLPLFRLGCNVPQCPFDGNGTNDKGGGGGGRNKNKQGAGTLKALSSHLASQHSPPLQLCTLCVDNKRDFVSRLPRYTPAQLKQHNNFGDDINLDDNNNNNNNNNNGQKGGKRNNRNNRSKSSANPIKGHPLCEFCKPKRFYDLPALHTHLNQDHYKCHICETHFNKPNQFFKHYPSLNAHFDRQHFLCRFPECLEAKFVVFANEIDLVAHERDVHNYINGGAGGSTKVTMSFRTEGAPSSSNRFDGEQELNPGDFNYGLDGQVFEPDDPTVNNATTSATATAAGQAISNEEQKQEQEPDITHLPHAERTAMIRAEAARKRQEQEGVTNGNTDEVGFSDFPSLDDANPKEDAASGRGGWTNEGRAAVMRNRAGRATAASQLTAEQFPALGGGKKKVKKLSTHRPVTNTRSSGAGFASSLTASASRAAPPARQLNLTQQLFSNASIGTTRAVAAKPKANLKSGDDFPTLGGGGGGGGGMGGTSNSNPYAAARALGRKNLKQKASGVKPAAASYLTGANRDTHFPPPPTSSSSSSLSSLAGKKKAASNLDRKPSADQLNNILDFPPPPASSTPSITAQVDAKNMVKSMKEVLGKEKYKTLKSFTAQFAANALDAESYIQSSASLFPNGLEDPSFWKFIPNLMDQCPNEYGVKRGKEYLQKVRRGGGGLAASQSSAASAGGSWNAGASARIASSTAAKKTGVSATDNGNGKKKSKSKQKKNELRNLAFGS